MNQTSIFLAILSVLVTLVGTLVMMIYRDTARRLTCLENKSAAVLMTVLLLLGHMQDVPPELIKAIQVAIADRAV